MDIGVSFMYIKDGAKDCTIFIVLEIIDKRIQEYFGGAVYIHI